MSKMSKKKKSIKQQTNWPQKARKLIKQKPKEFITGVLTLILISAICLFLIIDSSTTKTSWPSSKQSQPKISITQPINKFHIMQEGESLWDVASREYNNPYLYPTLVELNNLSSPDMVEPGMKIRVR